MERNQIPYFSKTCSIQCTYHTISLFLSLSLSLPLPPSLSPSLSLSPSSTIFLQPTDKKEIANMVSSLNFYKAFGPNSVPYRILFLVKNKILKQLGDLFSLNLMTCFFPSVFKTGKVVPVFKKDSKLDYSNYYPISLLSNIEKILKILCIRDCIPFSIIMLSITVTV